jgi:hypothetical protein
MKAKKASKKGGSCCGRRGKNGGYGGGMGGGKGGAKGGGYRR